MAKLYLQSHSCFCVFLLFPSMGQFVLVSALYFFILFQVHGYPGEGFMITYAHYLNHHGVLNWSFTLDFCDSEGKTHIYISDVPARAQSH